MAALICQAAAAANPAISYSVNAGELTLSWPETGWTLQTQTNGLNPANWVAVPGTEAVTTANLPLVTANPPVFYRLCQAAGPAVTNYFIYEGTNGMVNGYFDNGYLSTINDYNTAPVHSGSYSLAISLEAGGAGGAYRFAALDTSPYNSLSFWINGGATGGQKPGLVMIRGSAETGGWGIPALPTNAWVKYSIPFSVLGINSVADFHGLRFKDTSGAGQAEFYVGQIYLSTAAAAPVPPLFIYDDAVAPTWIVNGFGGSSSLDPANASPVYSGTRSMALTIEPAPAGAYGLVQLSGVNTTNYNSISFWINGGATGGQHVKLNMVQNSVPAASWNLPPLPTNNWVQYKLPLSMLGVANVKDFMGFRMYNLDSGTVTFYMDQVQLSAEVVPAPPYILYDDAIPAGAYDYSYGNPLVINYANTSPVHSGTHSISTSWTSWGALSWGNFSVGTAPYTSFNFWINGGPSGGQNLTLLTFNNWNLVGSFTIPALPANTWTNYSLPLSSIGLSNVTQFNAIRIYNNNASQPTFYVDDVQLR